MAYDIISKLSDSTVESNVGLIKHLIGRIKDQKTNEEFKDPILDFLSKKEKFPYGSNYGVIGSKYSLGCLIGNFLYHYISEEDDQKQLHLLSGLLEFVKGFETSQNPLLRKTMTIKLIEMLDKFGMPEYFLKRPDNQPLRIFLIPYKRPDVNGAYYPHIHCVASYRPRQSDLNPEYVFVHEIGHVLTHNLTGDPNSVPDSFIEFNKKFNPSWTGELVEVFVDLFAMAAMMDTEFASKNPHLRKPSIGTQKIVRDYFDELMKNIKYSDSRQAVFFI